MTSNLRKLLPALLLIGTAIAAAAMAWPASGRKDNVGNRLAALALTPPPQPSDATNPPTPRPAPGETHIPAPALPGEDELPPTPAARQEALDHLRAVARCARARGAEVPDPVSDAQGVHLGWPGGPRPELEAALRSCDPQLR